MDEWRTRKRHDIDGLTDRNQTIVPWMSASQALFDWSVVTKVARECAGTVTDPGDGVLPSAAPGRGTVAAWAVLLVTVTLRWESDGEEGAVSMRRGGAPGLGGPEVDVMEVG